jgi:hypothetical protein
MKLSGGDPPRFFGRKRREGERTTATEFVSVSLPAFSYGARIEAHSWGQSSHPVLYVLKAHKLPPVNSKAVYCTVLCRSL